MKQSIHLWLQSRLHHHLRDPIRYVGIPSCLSRHLLSVSSPSAPAAESSCPTTSDSRSCTVLFQSLSKSSIDCSSTPAAPLFAFTRLYASQTSHLEIQTALPHSSAPPIAGWLIESRLHNTTPSLHPVSGTSPLLRVVPPLGSASVLSPSWFFHLWLLRSHRSPRFPRSARPPLASSGHLNAGCRFGP